MSATGPPPWEIYWDPGFETSLARMGIPWEIFDRLGRHGIDFLLHRDPYEPQATFTLGGTNSRYIHTRYLFPDLPAMVISFLADYPTRTVRPICVTPLPPLPGRGKRRATPPPLLI